MRSVETDCQDVADDEGSVHAKGVFMIWSKRSDWGIHCDIANPKLFEMRLLKDPGLDMRHPDLTGG